MIKRLPAPRDEEFQPITLGGFVLTATGVDVKGKPSWENFVGALEFAKRAHRSAGFWLADLLRYGQSRAEWAQRLSQVIDATGMSEKTAKNIRAVGAIESSRRRDDVEFSHHAVVAALPEDEQAEWLARAASYRWSVRDLTLHIRASRRRRVIEGQAVLEGVFRVIYADPPWIYGNRPPSGSGSQEHYPGMTIEQIGKLPVAAHTTRDAVLFLWVTAPMLYENPGPREVIAAWGFTPKTGIVWDKVAHNFGNYVSVRHEHLLICTRGSCTPDVPTPMPDSVQTIRQEGEHSAKPEEFRRLIEQLYTTGPYLELFGRDPAEGWTVVGNDAALWHPQLATA